MHVLLVGPDLEENLSLRYLSASLKRAGHTTAIATFDSAANAPAARAAARAADLVGLSMCYQVRAREFLSLARELKEDDPERPIVAGGHFASCAAKELLENHPQLDIVVIHEGEQTMVELADAAHLGPDQLSAVRGIAFRDRGQVVFTERRRITADLDSLPWPDRTGPARLVSGVPTAYMMGSRGCLGACDYCCISTLHRLAPGKKFRQREPAAIADEMAWLYHERGVRQFIFHDDNFLVTSVERNLARIDALDRALRERGLRNIGLVLKCRPADANRQVFLRLREMGLLRVFLGIESGSTAGLASIGRRQTVEEQHRALDLCADLDISTQYTIILFHPEATPQTMLDDLSFVRAHLGHPLSFCRAETYNGTPLEKRMIDSARAIGDYLARTYHYTDDRTTLAWSAARDLLRARCWSQSNLLGQVIRLDHLMAVFHHFYEGREVDRLVRDFLDCELAVNRDTVALLEEVIQTCADHPEAISPRRDQRLAEIGEREQHSRQAFERQICDLKASLRARSFEMIGLPRPNQAKSPGSFLRQLPRHAAAAVLAISLASPGCGTKDDDGVIEAPPPPVDAAVSGDTGYVEDSGVMEAPPPPVDAATPAADAGPDAGYVEDGGVMEAPPPPVDAGD